jgi:hypothetical protein
MISPGAMNRVNTLLGVSLTILVYPTECLLPIPCSEQTMQTDSLGTEKYHVDNIASAWMPENKQFELLAYSDPSVESKPTQPVT